MIVFFVLLVFTVIIIIDLVPMIKEKNKRGTMAFIAVLVPALTYSILLVLGVDIESLAVIIWKFMKNAGITYS